MPRGHGGAGYSDEYQRAAYDLVDGWNLVDEYSRKDNSYNHLHCTKQSPHRCWNVLKRRVKQTICNKTSCKCLKRH